MVFVRAASRSPLGEDNRIWLLQMKKGERNR